jgi:cytoskeletal protein CcmA (bactofilin family)
MFRKKDTESELPGGTEGAFRRAVVDAPAKSGAQSELPRRKVDLPGSPVGSVDGPGGLSRGGDLEPDKYGGKRLIVGEGIRLSGEISSCDRLVVEGEVEVTLNDTLALEIATSGRFTGGCEVEEADISGVYEGDLMVRRRLFVRGTGRLTGTIRYGELELERGGQIAGNVSVLAADGTASAGGSSKMTGAPASGRPPFGERPVEASANEDSGKLKTGT